MNDIKNVCVYSASSTKIDQAYFDAAEKLGKILAERKINLINGAGCLGLMCAISDATLQAGGTVTGVIALPGGCGTLEELLEIITWKQLGLYLKPVVILNINHFYDPLLEMLNQAIEQNFMRREHGAIWHVAETPEEAVNLLYNTPVWSKEIRKFAAI